MLRHAEAARATMPARATATRSSGRDAAAAARLTPSMLPHPACNGRGGIAGHLIGATAPSVALNVLLITWWGEGASFK
jgi:hypothetical protein